MSGLRIVKRDFSSNTIISDSQTTSHSGEQAQQDKLSASARRLKMIQDALNGDFASTEKKYPFSGPSKTAIGDTGATSAGVKRATTEDNIPPAKKRRLPSSWNDSETGNSASSGIASYSSTRALSSSASVNSVSKTTISVTSTSKRAVKPASVFLSAEQSHILKLVERGDSLFYTGSAGKPTVSSCSHDTHTHFEESTFNYRHW
jgi:hypothetical protein